MHFQPCTGFIEQAAGCAHGMSLDMAGDFDEFTGEDYRRWAFKGGGGGIIKSVVIGAVMGAVTAGIGFGLAAALQGTALAFGESMLAAGFMATVAQGAVMGGIGGSLVGACHMMEALQ